MYNIRFYCFILSLFALTAPSYGDILKPEDITFSSAQYYPQILQAYQSIKAEKTKIRKAEGKFDTVLTNDTFLRPHGFYDGNLIDTRIAQPLKEGNATVYSGYRASDGIFPVYEDERFTEDNGELYVGVKLSLLRDRMVNKNLTDISIAEQKVLEAQTKLVLDKLTIQKNALQHYWEWVISGHQYFAYQDLLELAQTRQENLKKQVDAGQLAAVYLQENEQYILKRLADFNLAKANLKTTAQALSLYYRNHKGEPMLPSISMLPPSIPKHEDTEIFDPDERLYQHPIFTVIDTQRNIFEQKLALAENDLMPYVDLDLKAAQDFGSGKSSLDESELIAMLKFKVPLQRNIAKAEQSYAKAKITELGYKERLQFEKLKIAVNKLLITLHNQNLFLHVTEKELALAIQMSKIEEQRFKNGISDFFTLNKREEDMMQVRIKRLKAQEIFFKMQEELKALVAELRPEFQNSVEL